MLNPSTLNLSYSANSSRYGIDTIISEADASFLGEGVESTAGLYMSFAGDVNGDGLDDFLIGAPYDSQVATWSGKAYLIFGNESGFTMDTSLANADASFLGESYQDGAGNDVSGDGDINGDGYDDIIINSFRNSENGFWTGQTYILFGKPSGWTRNTPLDKADASYQGVVPWDMIGAQIDCDGDLNGDGYDDIVISDYFSSENALEAGRVFIIFGRASNWSMDRSILEADAWFLGENEYDHAGFDVDIVGDVNNDGFDDLLIGAPGRVAETPDAGQAYLIFGKPTGWSKGMPLSEANASFVGEYSVDRAGQRVEGVGDVNNDNFDDFFISSMLNDEGANQSGQIYLIFGKSSGWEMGVNLSNADASFLGEGVLDYAGMALSGGGDVNGDGFDDFVIGSGNNDEGGGDPSNEMDGAGQAYLFYGKESGWTMDINLSDADASFIGEYRWDNAGSAVALSGDLDGDGHDDLLIGAPYNNEATTAAGQVYLIHPDINTKPIQIYSIKAYSDILCTNEVDLVHFGETVYVELTAEDANITKLDCAFVQVTSNISSSDGFRLMLTETGLNTGKFRSYFVVGNRTAGKINMINVSIGEKVSVTSVSDSSKSADININAPVYIRPIYDKTAAPEDELYRIHYYNSGYNPASQWTFATSASWLNWEPVNHDLRGIPDNGDVGSYWVRINITDGLGNYDEHYFSLEVKNAEPEIITGNNVSALEDELYYVDYNSSDDGQGTITWELETNATWLDFHTSSGELIGTPIDDDKGSYWANVTVHDGNDGSAWSNFTIRISDTNDPPNIITVDNTTVYEDVYYLVDYEAEDIDDPPELQWYLQTNATWLSIDGDNGKLEGTAENSDVGIYYVNISVMDVRRGESSHNFTLKVLNVNDAPEWTYVPKYTKIDEGELFSFQVKAVDVDLDTSLTYGLKSNPDSNVTINSETGLIEWTSNTVDLGYPYELEIVLSVTDGIETIWTDFIIKVIQNKRPEVDLILPTEGSMVSWANTVFWWDALDDDVEKVTYTLYLGKNKSAVEELQDSVVILRNSNETSTNISGLDFGDTYYWTVIPFDGLNCGECNDGVNSFIVNSPPMISSISTQETYVGNSYRFDINAEDENIADILNLEYGLVNAPEGMTIDSETGVITWKPTKDQVGKYNVKVAVSDGRDDVNTTFVIEVKEAEDRALISRQILITLTSMSIFALIISFLVAGTEIGKYKFYTTIYTPMYNKLHPDKIFNNYTRGQIHGYIQAKPGENYNSIKKALRLTNGSLAHHLRILEKEELIYSKRNRLSTRFYAKGMKAKESDIFKLNKVQKELVKLIKTKPGLTQHEIIDLVNKNQKTISYNLTKLVRSEILEVDQKGREKRYFMNLKGPPVSIGQPKSQDSVITEPTKEPMLLTGSPAGGAEALMLPPAEEPVPERVAGTEPEPSPSPEDFKI
jgi:predicted transcriptional regulator